LAPRKKFNVCAESKVAISGVVEVEKSSSEVVSASSEAEMLSRFSTVRPGCDSCSKYSPPILIGVKRSSTR
jgi:hypothetical protein